VPHPYELGSSAFDVQQPPTPPRRSTKTSVIWVLVLVLAIAVVGALGYAAMSRPDLLGLSGPQPTRRPAAALPTSPPSATQPPRTSQPTAAPPTPALAQPVAQFARFATDPGLSFHLTIDGTVKVGPTRIKMFMALDQSGSDFAAHMRFTGEGRRVNMNLVVKSEFAYARHGRGRWVRVNLDELDVPLDNRVFSQLKIGQAQYVRTETRRGKELHLLHVPSTVAGNVDAAELKRQGCDTESMAMEMWVRDDGTPVAATFDFSCDLESASGRQTFTASFDYAFSRVNRPIEISLPAGFR
jgi:hypothetical protein